MRNHLRMTAALAVSFLGSELISTLKADDWDKKTRITIDQSIEVQGTVLPPGSYVMRVLGSSDQRTVEILNAAENHLITIVIASPAYRLNPTGNSDFKFYDGAEGQPRALRTWFYPGDSAGLEFRSVPGPIGQSAGRHTNTTTGVGGD